MKLNITKIKRELQYEAFLLPALILFVIFYIIPIIFSFYYSLTDINLHSKGINFIGFQNYIRITTDSEVLGSIKNTLFFAFSTTIILNVVALLLALGLSGKFKLNNALRLIVFLPAIISSLVIGFVWSFLLSSNEYGLVNSMLDHFGVSPINWFGDVSLAMPSVMFVYIWQWSGWAMTIYIANIQTIPEEYYEAATIDGANSLQKFFSITLPQLVSSITANVVLFTIGGLKIYEIIVSTTNGGPGYATQTITNVLLKKGMSAGRYGYGSSIAIVLFAVIALISLIQLKFLNKWGKNVT